MQKECIAMLLAGGEGNRLGVLTRDRAKPAIPFGGKYRIIDFTLSNCVNSRIDTVGVLTQYQPLVLNEYIGNGQTWDLDRIDGGVHILPPYQKRQSADWYKGTANAIKQNIPFIEQYRPSYVLILSGDHVYKMDYSKMLQYHKEKEADCTIAVIDVTLKEASRFGIMNIRENHRIYEFEEKPKYPKSTKASMGIYIFNWDKLKTYLERDEEDKQSSNDFGKNIIPAMLNAGEKMYAYPFQGYWKDVGTIESLWQSNMDLLELESNIISYDSQWIVYAKSPIMPPHYISNQAIVTNSIVSNGCIIHGHIDSSIIFHRVKIEEDTIIRNSILMPGAYIKKGSIVNYAIIDENAVIGEHAIIGNQDKLKELSHFITVVERNRIIGDGEIVNKNNMVDKEMVK